MTSYLQRFWPVFLFGITMTILALVLSGTGDDGDSVHHYLFARYAYLHPGNFFDHWAKPLYVLLMAPFAQMGFWGVKLVNVGLMTLTLWCTMRIAEFMDIKRPWLVGFIICTMPELLHLTLSGLTEPLFAACLALGTLWFFEEKNVPAALLLSFLPFVRSEGLIVLSVVGVYMLLSGKWRLVPLLAVGHVVYGIAGWQVFGSPFWVFSKIPYATLNGHYGKGHWSHFFVSAQYYWGLLVSILVWIGLALGIWRWFGYVRRKNTCEKKELWLIYGVFAAYFGSHVVFWGLGIFNSFGLTRVMIGITCMTSIIASTAAERLIDSIPQLRMQRAATAVLAGGLLVSLLISPKFLQKFNLSSVQKTHVALADKYESALKQGKYTLYADAVNLGVAMDWDWFGEKRGYTSTLPDTGKLNGPTAVIWDNWYSVVESHTKLDDLLKDKRIKIIEYIAAKGEWPEPVTVLFVDTASAFSTSLLYYQSFETTEGSQIENWGLRDKRSLRLEKKNEYGPGLTLHAEQTARIDSIVIQCDVLLRDTANWEARFVAEYTSKTGKMLSWQGFSVNKQIQLPDTWTVYVLTIPILKDSLEQAEIRLYPWNRHESPIWIDNLTVRSKSSSQ